MAEQDSFSAGDLVIVRGAGEKEIRLVVHSIGDRGQIYCTNQTEWANYGADAPHLIGFPAQDVRHA